MAFLLAWTRILCRWSAPPGNASPKKRVTFRWKCESDFGFARQRALVLSPVLEVQSATMEIEGGEEFTFVREVMIVSDAEGAGYMRFSEDPAFSGVAFQSYADTTTFTLSAGAGEKLVYGQYVNPWDPSGRGTSAGITLLGDAKR